MSVSIPILSPLLLLIFMIYIYIFTIYISIIYILYIYMYHMYISYTYIYIYHNIYIYICKYYCIPIISLSTSIPTLFPISNHVLGKRVGLSPNSISLSHILFPSFSHYFPVDGCFFHSISTISIIFSYSWWVII